MAISATRVTFDNNTMTVDLTDGRTLRVPIAWFPRLLHATPAQRAQVELSRNGLHWEKLDEDISIAGLLAGRGDNTKSAASFKRRVHTDASKTKSPRLSKEAGLNGRHRDDAGQLHQRMGNTRIGALRETYGKDFAAGWRSDAKLETLLKETGAKSLTDFRKNHNRRG
jgi:hypothetical protein